jgi:hypothetical protein
MNYFTLFTLLSYFAYGIQYKLVPNDIFDIDDKEDKEDKDFDEEHFKFTNVEIEKDEVKVESSSENYEIEYEIESDKTNPIEIKQKYKSTNYSGFETETKSRVLIHGIQEWFDENFDGLMQNNEKIGELYFVGENKYEDITYVGPNNYDVYDFTVSETSSGFLTMIAHLTSNFTEYYDPNSMKFDIIIQDWIYQNSENQLALLIEYRTESETESKDEDEDREDEDREDDEDEDDEEGYIYQQTLDPSLGYSALIWNTTIIYDNNSVGFVQTRMLNTSELNSLIETDDEYEGEQTSGMWFCFSAKGSNNIYWDPNIGVYTTPLSSTSSSSSSSSSNNYLTSTTIGGIVAASIAGCIIICVSYYIVTKIKSNKNPPTDAETHHLTKL